MPIVQPHQNKFRVFLLIAQLMVQKLFLGAHFKITFCWLSLCFQHIEYYQIWDAPLKITSCHALSNLDVSISIRPQNYSFPFFTGASVTTVASSSGGTSTSPCVGGLLFETKQFEISIWYWQDQPGNHIPPIVLLYLVTTTPCWHWLIFMSAVFLRCSYHLWSSLSGIKH